MTPGDRVQLHPATDLWMRGARYGTVVRVTPGRILVRVDRLDRAVWVKRGNVLSLGGAR